MSWLEIASYWHEIQVAGGSGGAPGGADTQVQFNDGGVIAGDAGLTYDAATDTLTTGRYKAADGTVAAPALTGTTNATTGVFFPSSFAIGLSSGGTGKALFDGDFWRFASAGGIGITAGNYNAATDTYVTRGGAAATLQLGAAAANSNGVDQTLQTQGGITGTDRAGGDLTIQNGPGTGAGVSKIVFRTPTPVGSGTTEQTQATRMTLNAFGVNVVIPAYADNTAAIAVIPAGNLYYTDVAGEYIVKVAH